jgi:hypothetical protein
MDRAQRSILNNVSQVCRICRPVVKSSIFWDITLCSPFKVKRRFRGNMSPPSSGLNNKPRDKLETRQQKEPLCNAYENHCVVGCYTV